jgi:glutathione synthase/RimK-type ligase-like ATP-grasp enzyme
MKAVLLCPAEDYPETYDWAYDNQAEALEAAGFEVIGRRWTDDAPEADADIVLPLVAWGYHHRIDQWHALLDRLEAACVAVLNPVPLLRWNSDKAYLTELGAAGVPTVATIAVDALDDAALAEARARFATTELVVKPPVSAAADGTYRVAAGEEVPEAVRGRRMLIQPFQRAISTQGELSLLLFGGELSHALIKRPKPGDYRVQPHLGGTETLVDEHSPAPATYARVDMIADEAGAWQIMELELIEPALWLPRAPGSAERFAAAVAAQAEQILAQR